LFRIGPSTSVVGVGTVIAPGRYRLPTGRWADGNELWAAFAFFRSGSSP
jgi:hypothetical protein